jgi:hypothetical protein
LINSPTITSEVSASTHHAPSASCARTPINTTKDSQPQVMLSTASARKARLSSAPPDPACRALGLFRHGPTVPQLDVEPPDQHTSRGQFNQAIKAEGDQADAARRHPCGKGDHSLDDHPANDEPFQPECRCQDQQREEPHRNLVGPLRYSSTSAAGLAM